ncbi:MerR family transcriptional regulator, partial [Desulfovibrio sp. OttesenSCG-928-C14]|nr:MerR family transcriptional regulator [Desulfovibrio sp. OttesenSCG-928-C14]
MGTGPGSCAFWTSFWARAEFAALCGTTKETLFHYDRIGLLRPRRVSGNGYRSYAAEQFFEFDLIGVLKDAGSSLEEIKAYLSEYDPENFLKILEEKRLLLEKEQARLARRQESLRHIAEATRAALAGQVGKLEIMELEAEGLIAVRTDPEEEWSWSYMASYMRDHFRHCEAIGLTSVFPLGCIVERERILAG